MDRHEQYRDEEGGQGLLETGGGSISHTVRVPYTQERDIVHPGTYPVPYPVPLPSLPVPYLASLYRPWLPRTVLGFPVPFLAVLARLCPSLPVFGRPLLVVSRQSSPRGVPAVIASCCRSVPH